MPTLPRRQGEHSSEFDGGVWWNMTLWNETSVLTAEDMAVFLCLETLGVLAFVGNVTLAAVIIRYRYLNKASFILMFSLACADILHAVVTTTYFYPPIVLKFNHMPHLGCRIYNAIDWTAWAITITHMSGVCIDRVVAIMLYSRYTSLMTPTRVKYFSASCWTVFLSMNLFFFAMDYCCVIKPKGGAHDYYTFDFDDATDAPPVTTVLTNTTAVVTDRRRSNVYPPIYTPLEITTMIVLLVSNPITLFQLWQRHKRKMALRRASAMLLEVSQTMTLKDEKHKYDDATKASEVATHRQQRQQQRIFVQIIAVTLIFFMYMFVYYLFFYAVEEMSKWAIVFNSLFYSTTHMINPVVYFGLNEEMRNHLFQLLGCRPPRRRQQQHQYRNEASSSLASKYLVSTTVLQRQSLPSTMSAAMPRAPMPPQPPPLVVREQSSTPNETSPLINNCVDSYRSPVIIQRRLTDTDATVAVANCVTTPVSESTDSSSLIIANHHVDELPLPSSTFRSQSNHDIILGTVDLNPSNGNHWHSDYNLAAALENNRLEPELKRRKWQSAKHQEPPSAAKPLGQTIVSVCGSGKKPSTSCSISEAFSLTSERLTDFQDADVMSNTSAFRYYPYAGAIECDDEDLVYL